MTETAVPPGERAELQRTARETGERMGSMDAVIKEHDQHLDKINGSIATLAEKMTELAQTVAVMGTSVATIERVLDTKMLSHESRLTVIEAWVAERRGGSSVSQRGRMRSTQWWLAVFAAGVAVMVAVMGAFVTVAVALVVLAANGRL